MGNLDWENILTSFSPGVLVERFFLGGCFWGGAMFLRIDSHGVRWFDDFLSWEPVCTSESKSSVHYKIYSHVACWFFNLLNHRISLSSWWPYFILKTSTQWDDSWCFHKNNDKHNHKGTDRQTGLHSSEFTTDVWSIVVRNAFGVSRSPDEPQRNPDWFLFTRLYKPKGHWLPQKNILYGLYIHYTVICHPQKYNLFFGYFFLKSNKPTTMSQSNPCHLQTCTLKSWLSIFFGGVEPMVCSWTFFWGCQKTPASEPNNKHPGWNVFSLRTSYVHYSTLLYPARLGSVFVGAWFAWGLDGFLPINHVLIAILEEL